MKTMLFGLTLLFCASAHAFEKGEYNCVYDDGMSKKNFQMEVGDKGFTFVFLSFEFGENWKYIDGAPSNSTFKYKAEEFPNAIVVSTESDGPDMKIFGLISIRNVNGETVIHQHLSSVQKTEEDADAEAEIEDFVYTCEKLK